MILEHYGTVVGYKFDVSINKIVTTINIIVEIQFTIEMIASHFQMNMNFEFKIIIC